jgi:hypothetical protein
VLDDAYELTAAIPAPRRVEVLDGGLRLSFDARRIRLELQPQRIGVHAVFRSGPTQVVYP